MEKIFIDWKHFLYLPFSSSKTIIRELRNRVPRKYASRTLDLAHVSLDYSSGSSSSGTMKGYSVISRFYFRKPDARERERVRTCEIRSQGAILRPRMFFRSRFL